MEPNSPIFLREIDRTMNKMEALYQGWLEGKNKEKEWGREGMERGEERKIKNNQPEK